MMAWMALYRGKEAQGSTPGLPHHMMPFATLGHSKEAVNRFQPHVTPRSWTFQPPDLLFFINYSATGVCYSNKSKRLRDEGKVSLRPRSWHCVSLRRHSVLLLSSIPHRPPRFFFHREAITCVSSQREALQNNSDHFTVPRGTHI